MYARERTIQVITRAWCLQIRCTFVFLHALKSLKHTIIVGVAFEVYTNHSWTLPRVLTATSKREWTFKRKICDISERDSSLSFHDKQRTGNRTIVHLYFPFNEHFDREIRICLRNYPPFRHCCPLRNIKYLLRVVNNHVRKYIYTYMRLNHFYSNISFIIILRTIVETTSNFI